MKLGDLLTSIGRANAYYPNLTKVTKSTKATLFLSQLCYWEGKQQDTRNHWIYKSAEEMELETGLTRREQEGARKILKELGILEEMYARIPRTLHFRVNFDVLERLWQEYQDEAMHEMDKLISQDEPMHKTVNLMSQNGQSMHQMSNLYSTNCGINIHQNSEPITEITQKNTQEITDDSLRSSDTDTQSDKAKALSKESKFIGSPTAKTTLDAVVKQTAERSKKVREKKEGKPRKVPENTNTLLKYFSSEFTKTFGGIAPLELGKDRKLMKQAIDHYGYANVKMGVDWTFRNWAKFRRECNITGVPTVGMLFGFRGYLQEQLSATAEVNSKGVVGNEWGV